MKKIIFSLAAIFFAFQFVAAQPTQAEIDKRMKAAQLEIDKMKNDPKYKEYTKNIPNLDSVKKNMPQGHISTASTKKNTGPQVRQFPEKNKLLLASIPKNTFTKPELVAYCNLLYKQLSAKISPAKVKAVNDAMAKPGGNTYKFNLASVASWYNGAEEEAILMALKATALDPDYDVLVNNVSGMLNLGGLGYKAIPILKTLLEKYPGNPMVLNNLGQAYAGLGDTDTAMSFFSRCIRQSPNHPEANNTAGQIELAKGNKGKAKEYFEHSISGAFNLPASNALQSIYPEVKYSKYVRPRVHIPEYFSPDKYRLPQQCENIDQAAAAKEEHDAFEEMLAALIKKYSAIENEESKIAEETVTQKLMVGVNKNHELMPAYFALAAIMLGELNKERTDDLIALAKYNDNFKEENEKLEKKYELAQKAARDQFKEREENEGEGHADPTLDEEICKAYEHVANEYLTLFSNLRRDWQIKNLAISKKYLDDLIYWSCLVSIDIHDFRRNFYSLVVGHLATLKNLCETKIIYPCKKNNADKQKADSLKITEPECPLDFEIKFIVGKYSINCDKISFSAGEGLVFKYEKNFSKHQSTMSLGIGAQLELGGGFGGVKIGAGAGLSESIFIKFDASGQVMDAGLKFDAKAGAGAGAKVKAGERITVKKDLSNIETGVGYTVGIESGWNFDEGPLKNLLSPPETQVNKKVPVYKPGE
jgi:tetratricopeptide (TPR) repeat protein